MHSTLFILSTALLASAPVEGASTGTASSESRTCDPADSFCLEPPGELRVAEDPDLEDLPESRSNGSGFEGSSNEPSDYGSGYASWTTLGGGTLGDRGYALRASLNGGQWNRYGRNNGALEAMFFLPMGADFDLGVGVMLSMWWFGLSPEVSLRFRFMENDAFHLAFQGDVMLGFHVGNRGPRNNDQFYFGLHVEPGLVASYFIMDAMEIYFGLMVPINFSFVERFGTSIGWDLRGGFVFTLKKINLGLFLQLDLIPSAVIHDHVGGVYYVDSGFDMAGGVKVGVQYRFETE